MKIGELALRSGLAPSRIRFYERIGLLPPPQRAANSYRAYPEDAVLLLQMIAAAQQAGFSLDEVRAVLPPDLGAWQADALLQALRRKVADVEALQARLSATRTQLLAFIAQIEGKPAEVDCASHAQAMLGRMQAEAPAPPAAPAGRGRPRPPRVRA